MGKLTVLVHDGELSLLVNGKLGVHETLIAGIGLLDISQMPFAYVRGVVARIPEYLRQGDFFSGTVENRIEQELERSVHLSPMLRRKVFRRWL